MSQYAAQEAAAFLYLSCPIIKYILPLSVFSLPSSDPTTFHSSSLCSKSLKLRRTELSCYSISSWFHKILFKFKGEKLLNTPLLHLDGLFPEIWGKNPQITVTKFWAVAHDVIQTDCTHLHILIWTGVEIRVETYLKTTIFSRSSSKIHNCTEVCVWVWDKEIHPELAIHR